MLDYRMFDNMIVNAWKNEDVTTMEEIFEKNNIVEVNKAQYALEEIKKRINMANKKQEEIDSLTYIKRLILSDVTFLIREDIAQSYFNIFSFTKERDLLIQAGEYFHCKNQKTLNEIEEDHKKDPDNCESLEEYENSYEFALRTIMNRLIPDKYREGSTLTSIIDYNYSSEFEFVFDFKGIEYIICIPIFDTADNDNYSEILSGYSLRFHEDKYCVDLAFSELNPDKFKERLEEWLDDRLKESQND